MPYHKPLLHQERIPWISSHPLDVKKDMFYGEMSCLTMLSSTQDHYLRAIWQLVALYVKQDYPEKLVVS